MQKTRQKKKRLCQTVHRNGGIGGIPEPEPEGEAVQGVMMDEKIKARDVMDGKREMPAVRLDLVSTRFPLGRGTAQDGGADVEHNKVISVPLGASSGVWAWREGMTGQGEGPPRGSLVETLRE